MPKVPTYDSFQAMPTVPTGVAFTAARAPGPGMVVAQQAEKMGQAAMGAGGEVAKIIEDKQAEANQALVDDGLNQLVQARTKLQLEAMSLTGRAALERPDGKSIDQEYGEKFNEAVSGIAGTLKNPAQEKAFRHAAAGVGNSFIASVGAHMVQQQKQFQADQLNATVSTAAQQAGMLYADPSALAESKAMADGAVSQMIRLNGWDAEKDKNIIAAARVKAMTDVHSAALQGMLQSGMVDKAREYYNANSAEMSLQARATLSQHIGEVETATKGDNAAQAAWDKFAPANPNEPVRLFDMEAEARKQFADNPKARDAALAGLRQRAQAFNAQQAEANAGNINGVYKMLDSGAGLAKIQSSPQWLALPGAKQHEIIQSIENLQATRANRAAAEESRAFTRVQREDRMAMFRNGEAYLRYSDPDVLAGMSRTQVEALRPTFGFEGTQQLLQRFDTLQNKDAKLNAKMDDSAFNAIVRETLDIDPYKKGMTSEQKGMLGTLKNRVDILLQQQAQSLRRPLTTEEKTELFRAEAAKTVTVNGWLWNSEKPAAALTPAEAADVVVPADARAKITARLQREYQATQDPAFAPTEQNLRRYYLKTISPIAGLPNAKQ